VADGTVFIGSTNSNMYAINAASGSERWTFSAGDDFRWSSPTVADGTVFVGSDDNNVYALDADSGERVWSRRTGDYVRSSPTVAGGTVFVGSNDGSVYALDAESGDIIWSEVTGGLVRSSPTVADGTLFVGTDNNTVYALDAESGDIAWTFDTGKDVRSSPTVADGTVFVGCNDNTVYALDAESGDTVWTFDTNRSVRWSSPTVVDGTLFVGERANTVHAIDAGVEGSSTGSRVNLGTLGHHFRWAAASLPLGIAYTPSIAKPDEPIQFQINPDIEQEVTVDWTFGDGDTTQGQSVTHAYTSAGEYTVEAAISGAVDESLQTTVTIPDGLGFESDPAEPITGEDVRFRGVGSDTGYTWEFGDGTTAKG